ncbi:MAG: toprim domain-containing protein [Candidatus Dependentiae bacterium]|nr:toprim domain-containing protein [Candidatus Dependentiae bacterium]
MKSTISTISTTYKNRRIAMILLNLVHEKGLTPKWVASTEGGEYHSSCPSCVGTDRFVIQPSKQMKKCVGSYFCRRCGAKGDSIQFCLEYLGLSFKEAVDRVGAKMPEKIPNIFAKKKSNSAGATINKPSAMWSQQARKLVDEAHENLLSQKGILALLNKRGLPIDAIQQYKIGWIEQSKNMEGHLWGLEKETIWLPAGILIPTIEKSQSVIRFKIRRKDWQPNDQYPKYIALSGSMSGLNIIGDKNNPIMIVVESELDAYALHHAVRDFAVVVAVGGCTKNPDSVTDYLAKNKTVLLICHDNDDAGKNMLTKWKGLYSRAQGYPTPIGKDIGEAIEQGLDLRTWIIEKLPVQMQYDLHLINQPWSQEDQSLTDWVLHYINERTVTRYTYDKLEQEINLGANSPRAKIGELQNYLKFMKRLIEGEYENKEMV